MQRRIKSLFAGGILAFALFGAAIAGPLEDGVTAFGRGDYAEAMRLWRPLAEQGYTLAQVKVGLMFLNGWGVPQDDPQGMAWFRKAADQGDANAQLMLGNMYAKGQGVAQNYAQAAAWYRKAADQGSADAQFKLGDLYADGRGVPQDDAEAAAWLRKAADQGNALAQLLLGVTYVDGRGVPQDYVRAHMWLNLAAAGSSNNPSARELSIKERAKVAAMMTPGQIAEAQVLAREWKPTPSQ